MLRRNTTNGYARSISINRGLIQAIPTSLPPQPIGEATKASKLSKGIPLESREITLLLIFVIRYVLGIVGINHCNLDNLPGTESDCDSEDMEEEVEYMTDDEVVMSEQEESNHGYTQNIQHFEEKDDVDKWLNAEITKHMSMQGVKNTEDAKISIIKSIKKEMKDDIMKKQIEASTASIGNETSSIASNEVDTDDDNTASCLLPKELSPGSFLLPFNIDNHSLYAITTLDAKDNIIPLNVYEYLGLDEFRGASTVENTTGTNKPLGTIDILVKFGTLEFLCNFVIKIGDDVIILGRPFLESTHAQIDVFIKEILFEIGRENFKFNINSHQCVEKIYMVDTGQEEETFDPLEIGMDLFSYESPACLEFEQRTRYNEVFGVNEQGGLRCDYDVRVSRSDHEKGVTWDLLTFFSYDVEEEYARETGDPYSRRFNEYNRVFKNEIEHISNECILRIGKKGYVLDDVWEKCQQNYKKTNEAWHDEAYEEEEMWRIGHEKTDYDPPYINIETFEVKKYSFKGGRSFICITDREDEALPLGRVNGARFKAMIWKDLGGP
ncbi:phospholipase-like protein [Tanacetum coccineum]